MPLEQELREFVIQNFLFGQDGERLRNDDSFLDSGVIDSTGVIELVSFLERSYGIKVEDEDLVPENFDSIDGLMRFVRAKPGGSR